MLDAIYPGGLRQWELLWLQNVVFVFVQFTTGVALYTDDDRYLGPLAALGSAILRRTGRDRLLTLHAAGGLTVVGLNLAFVGAWYFMQPLGPMEILTSRPAIGIVTGFLTVAIVGLGVTGTLMYGYLRPATSVPTPNGGYSLARKFHRGLVASLVAVLGYHLFLTPRVTLVWTAWLRAGHPFGLVVIAMIAVWGLLAGQSVRMVAEWTTGRLISGGGRRHRLLGVVGVAVALSLAVLQVL